MAYSFDEGEAMRNQKFIKIVVWIIAVLVVAGLLLPVITSMFGLF